MVEEKLPPAEGARGKRMTGDGGGNASLAVVPSMVARARKDGSEFRKCLMKFLRLGLLID